MHEIDRILESARQITAAGEAAVLATVVDTSGSTLRHSGARLLIRASGETVGFVSAGCVEKDLAEHAAEVLRSGTPKVLAYSAEALDDTVTGFGLGCRGTLRLLLERLPGPTTERVLAEIAAGRRQRCSLLLATILAAGEGEGRVSRATLSEAGRFWSDLDDRRVENQVREHLVALSSPRQAEKIAVGIPGMEVLVERLSPPPALVIVGGGATAAALAQVASSLGWVVTVADHRSPAGGDLPLPEDVVPLVCPPEEMVDRTSPDARTAVVLLTHNLVSDKVLVPGFLASPAFYVGLIASRGRAERLLAEIEAEGRTLSAAELARLFTPVGLDLGAETAEELALAVASEILAVQRGRQGGCLKNRGQPAHASPRFAALR